jgi:hypothetical protein
METNYQKYHLSIFHNGNIIEKTLKTLPNVGEKILNGNEILVVTASKFINKITTLKGEEHYYSMVVKLDEEIVLEDSLVGVTQVKIIVPEFGGKDASKAIEEALNKWLFENRFTHFVFDITYMQFGVAIKYRLRNEVDQREYKAAEMSYKKCGETIKYQRRVFQAEVSQSCIVF